MIDLQELLEQTQENYELIPQFLDQLLLADVYCLGSKDSQQQLQFRVLETPEGDQAIPFFLSLDVIHQDLGVDVPYLVINTRKLFEMTAGATLVLNPTTALAKEFDPEEIQSILNMDKLETDTVD